MTEFERMEDNWFRNGCKGRIEDYEIDDTTEEEEKVIKRVERIEE